MKRRDSDSLHGRHRRVRAASVTAHMLSRPPGKFTWRLGDDVLGVHAALGPDVGDLDEGLGGLGLAISFGASCTFVYGGREINLASGDVLIGPFGRVSHEVLRTHGPDSAPAWWRAPPSYAEVSACTFGRAFGTSQCSLGRLR